VERGTVPVRIHTPDGPAPMPAHVLMHAGAFCYGAPQELDPLAAEYARAAGCVVLVPDYALAPEHPYPAALEDCYAVLRWTVAEAGSLGIDATRISVGGISAGGALAAALTLLARDRGGPAPIFQLLEVPVTDLTLSCASIRRYGRGYLLTAGELAECDARYVPDPQRRLEPYASPLLAADLAGLPPAMVITAQFDPLRDEGEAYARRLRAAGVPTELLRGRCHVHSSIHSGMRSARRIRRQAAAALARAYAAAQSSS
jgi:acetyl esterase